MKRPKSSAQTLMDVHASPGHLMRRSQQIAVAIFFEEVGDLDLTPVQFAALTGIKDNPEIDQRRLVDLIAIDRSTVGTMVQRLEEKGLITRTTPNHNRRIKQLAVTQSGVGLLAKARASVERAQERILAPLTASEKKDFMRLLGRLVDINNAVSRVPLKVEKGR